MRELILFLKCVHASLEYVLRIDRVTEEKLSFHFHSKLCDLESVYGQT